MTEKTTRERMTRCSFTLPEDMDEAINRFCDKIDWNKSTFLRFCVRYTMLSLNMGEFMKVMDRRDLKAIMDFDAIQVGGYDGEKQD